MGGKNKDCLGPVFKLQTKSNGELTGKKTVIEGDTIEFCSKTLDVSVGGNCCKTKVSIETIGSEFEKKFPIQQGKSVDVGDVVTIGKTGGQLGIRKVLCEEWEWAAAIDSKGGVAEQIGLSGKKSIAVDDCGNIYVTGYGEVTNM